MNLFQIRQNKPLFKLNYGSILGGQVSSNLEVEQVFTSYNNPKGNADTERMIRTMKEELFWLREWENERELSLELDKWVDYYNRNYLHSTLGYRTPIQSEVEYHKNHNSHKNAA